jgi:hypothetical protein
MGVVLGRNRRGEHQCLTPMWLPSLCHYDDDRSGRDVPSADGALQLSQSPCPVELAARGLSVVGMRHRFFSRHSRHAPRRAHSEGHSIPQPWWATHVRVGAQCHCHGRGASRVASITSRGERRIHVRSRRLSVLLAYGGRRRPEPTNLIVVERGGLEDWEESLALIWSRRMRQRQVRALFWASCVGCCLPGAAGARGTDAVLPDLSV